MQVEGLAVVVELRALVIGVEIRFSYGLYTMIPLFSLRRDVLGIF